MTDKVLTERRGGVLVITLNRPEVKNAIDTDTAWAVSHALDELDDDRDARRGCAHRHRLDLLCRHGPQGVPRR